MTDLEMTRLCAEAMGLTIEQQGYETRAIKVREHWPTYDPLRDDAQAMALVKKFPWQAFMALTDLGYGKSWSPLGNEFNRSVVECAAKMQQEKEAK